MAREKKRALDVENMRSNVDIAKNLESLKTELVSVAFVTYQDKLYFF